MTMVHGRQWGVQHDIPVKMKPNKKRILVEKFFYVNQNFSNLEIPKQFGIVL
jgi:hypothetical protein